jgi:hypothetical protein
LPFFSALKQSSKFFLLGFSFFKPVIQSQIVQEPASNKFHVISLVFPLHMAQFSIIAIDFKLDKPPGIPLSGDLPFLL